MGKWTNHILKPSALADTERHIPLEDLALFTQGQVQQKKRETYIRHLNQCPVCYETLQETLADISEEEVSLPEAPLRTSSRGPMYALAASLLLAVLIGGGIFFSHHGSPPQVLTASLVLDAELRAVLTEDESLVWEGERVQRLAVLLQEKGVGKRGIRKVEMASPYLASKDLSKMLLGKQEVLKIRIEKGVAYLEVE